MTLQTLVTAKWHEAPISPAARLTLLGLGDLCEPDGSLTNTGPESVVHWTHLPEAEGQQAWDELVAAGIVHIEASVPALDGMAWLTIIDGWDAAWADLLWASFRIPRPAIPLALRLAVMQRDGGVCQHCGTTDLPTIDHIHPVTRGGLTVLANLRVLCRGCNSSKGAALEVAR